MKELAPKDTWASICGEWQTGFNDASYEAIRFYFFLDVPLPKTLLLIPDHLQNRTWEHFQDGAKTVQLLIDHL
jgi:hypothetical protein